MTLLLAAAFSVLPLLYLLATSLSASRSRVVSLRTLAQPTLENYQALFASTSMGRWTVNSLLVATMVTLVILFIDSLAGYAFAKRQFLGKEVVFITMLVTLMIPLPVTMLPTYLAMNRLGLVDTFTALVTPGLASAMGIFLMRQFIASIPDELEEAAVIDGLSTFKIYTRIIIPLSVPALAVLALFTFLFQWSSLMWPLIVATSDKTITLPVGLSVIPSQFATDYGLVAAGSVIAIVPMLLVFLPLRRYLAASVVAGRTQKG